MKLILLLCALIGLVHGTVQKFLDEAMERMETTIEECVEELGITEEELAEITEQEIPSSKIGTCLIACYHKKFGIQNSAGMLDKDGAMNAMRYLKDGDLDMYEKAAKLFEICMDEVQNEECECETAANFMVCFNNRGREMGVGPGMVPL